MSAALALTARGVVRVAASLPRREALARAALSAGFVVSETEGVVLTDDPAEVPPDGRAVLLGTGEADAVLGADAEPDEIEAALLAVSAGLVVRRRAASGFDRMPEPDLPLLTPREIDVVEAASRGLSNKAIARALAISPHTVKFHMEAVFRKLGVATRAEAVRRFMLSGRVRV